MQQIPLHFFSLSPHAKIIFQFFFISNFSHFIRTNISFSFFYIQGGFLPCFTLFRTAKTRLSSIPLPLQPPRCATFAAQLLGDSLKTFFECFAGFQPSLPRRPAPPCFPYKNVKARFRLKP